MDSKKIFLSLTTACLLICSQSLNAQGDSDKPGSDFKSRLWFGGNIGLNFFGYNGGNVFQIGIAPMVGYKIIEPLSVGPRVSLFFNSLKQPGFKAVGLFDVDAGVFVRGRIYRGLFIQAEVSNEWYQNPIFYNDGTTDKETLTRVNPRIGIGYNWSGGQGGAGSEIGIFYNLTIADDLETYELPLEYRFGFTWNF